LNVSVEAVPFVLLELAELVEPELPPPEVPQFAKLGIQMPPTPI
jgi:hypothetical protein